MSSPRRSFADIINGLIAKAGSANAFIRSMKEAGASVTPNAVLNWRRGAHPRRSAHQIVVARLAGLSVEEVLRASLSPEDEALLYPKAQA